MADQKTRAIQPVSSSQTAEPEAEKPTDIAEIERVLSPESDLKKDHMNFDRVDDEVAKYVSTTRIEISEEENKRLRRLINRRVLPIMIFTYFLQALDKGTLSFTSIMNLPKDLNLVGQQV